LENSVRFPRLLKADPFKGLPADFKKEFLNACTVAIYDRATIIFEQGKPASEVMILAHGYVDVTYSGAGRQEMFVIRLRPGTIISEMEVISGLPCLATCTTSENATLLRCPRPLLDQALKQPAFLKNMVSSYYWRLSYVNWSKYVAQFGTVAERLRGYLYVLSEQTQTIRDSQSYLANMIGCSRQAVNRELRLLRDEGLIAQSGSQIMVLDRERLVV
jgi:CRP-like cAMP-binding protein